MRILEVAYAVAYTTDTFTRTFLKKYRVAPEEYMEKIKNFKKIL
jgi:AraC-like DNA-binding protein